MKLGPRFLAKYLKVMSIIAIVSAFLDMIAWIVLGFKIPSWAAAIAWLGSGLMFFATAKLLEEVKT